MTRQPSLCVRIFIMLCTLSFLCSVVSAQQTSQSPAVTKGYELIKQKKCQEALSIFKSAASAGDAKAAEAVGGLYEFGFSCPNFTRDYQQAMVWHKKAADLGNSSAMSSIAEMYRTGKGVSQDIDQVLEWDRKAEAGAIAEGDGLEENVAHSSIEMDNLLKQHPDQLAIYKDHSTPDEAINAANRNAASSEGARVSLMDTEELLKDLRDNMGKATIDKLKSLELNEGLLTIVQFDRSGSESMPMFDVTQVPLAALDANDIHTEASSSGTSIVIRAKQGTPDDLLTNTNGFYVRHNVSISIEFTDAEVASITALEFARLVRLSNKSSAADWLVTARAERERASDPENYMRSAYYELGMNALNSNIGKRNSLMARHYFEQAAKNGDGRSSIQLARIYEQGIGVQQDLNESKKWYDAAKIAGAGDTVDQDIARVQNKIDEQRVLAQQKAAPEQAVQQQPETLNDSDRQTKISQLQSDIESQEQIAEQNEKSANQVLNNCSGPGAALCQTIGELGAAKLRQKAAEARNQADSDREEIAHLEGEEVQDGVRRDTSYAGNLQKIADGSESRTQTIHGSAATAQPANSSAPLDAAAQPSYQPNRHYQGQDSAWVSKLLARNGNWNCPTSLSEVDSAQGFTSERANVCMRDSYVWAAVLGAWGAECESRLSQDRAAAQDAASMKDSLINAAKLCSNAPVFGPGPECGTAKIVTCDELAPLKNER